MKNNVTIFTLFFSDTTQNGVQYINVRKQYVYEWVIYNNVFFSSFFLSQSAHFIVRTPLPLHEIVKRDRDRKWPICSRADSTNTRKKLKGRGRLPSTLESLLRQEKRALVHLNASNVSLVLPFVFPLQAFLICTASKRSAQ